MPHDHHDALSSSGHPFRADNDAPLTYWQTMEIAIRELLVEKGIATADEISAQIDAMDARSPATGARLVARAWVDPGFRDRLMQDACDAAQEIDIDTGGLRLIAVENTADLHNVIVCTLCSCYPRDLLGLPPDWYKTREYRSRVVREPRRVLGEFGLTLPDDVTIRVHESTADLRNVVIPLRPPGTDHLDETALAALVSRDSMIGTARASAPA